MAFLKRIAHLKIDIVGLHNIKRR